jgi:Cu(I)/Ag(I) efflux system periplasmic protein CusF
MKEFWAFTGTAVVAATALAQAPTVAGEVVKIDKAAARLTIKHAGIKHLDMPAMSIALRVRDPRMLDEVAVGDRVRFIAERADGQYVVTMLAKAPS